MTSTGTRHGAEITARDLLPAGRRFHALPSARRPVVFAERVPSVQRYVRSALLAVPPNSALPGWAFEAARGALRVPALWRLTPRVTGGPGVDPSSRLAGLLADAAGIVLLDHSRDPDRRFVLLLFPPGARCPTVAVKVPASSAAADRVRAEAARLRDFAALPLGSLRRTMPEVVDRPGHGGLPVLVTTAQPGTPMLVDYHRAGHTTRPAVVLADLGAAGNWLADFQAATSTGTAPLDLPPGVAETLRAQRDPGPDLAAVLAELPGLRDRLRAHSAPRTAVHGDFWPGNVLRDGGRLSGVVDWERAATAGSPVRDLARFAIGYTEYLDRHTRPGHRVAGHPGLRAGDPGGGIGYALDGDGWFPGLVRNFLADGLYRLRLPATCARDVVCAELAAIAVEATDADFARTTLRRFRALTGSGGRP